MEFEIRKQYYSYSSGQLESEKTYINNIEQGLQIYYYFCGNIEKKLIYKNGIIYGLHQHWWRDKTRFCINILNEHNKHGFEIMFKYKK